MYPKNCAECPHYNGCDSYYGSPNCLYGTINKNKDNIIHKIMQKIAGNENE